MSITRPMCILHLTEDGKSSAPLKEFTEQTWQNVKDAERNRHIILKTSKYFHVKIPDQFDSLFCYHTNCYKDYTAVALTKQVNNSVVCANDINNRKLRSEVEHPGSSSTGVFYPVCIFFGDARKWLNKKYERLGTVETKQGEDSIIEAANILMDNVLLSKLSGEDLVAKQAKFHHSCRNAYYKKSRRVNVNAMSENIPPNQSETGGSFAYDRIKQYVKQKLVDDCGSKKLTSLHKRYLSTKQVHEEQYKPQYLCDKLLREYPEDLITYKSSNKEGVVICNKSLSVETAVSRANFDGNMVKETAFYLRSLILSKAAEVDDLTAPLTEDRLRNGQNATPKELEDFFCVLYNSKREDVEQSKLQRLVKSTCEDVVFNTTRGRVKPGKHICLGLGLKSLTGSRKVIEILNRFGHSISYHTVEAMETQIATDISDKKNTTPDGIIKEPGLFTGLAWDNYDENTETLSGSGTLHDTVGICYQNKSPLSSALSTHVSPEIRDLDTGAAEKRKQRPKRTIATEETQLTPYRKKPKMALFRYVKKESARPECLTQIEWLDALWMFTFTTCERTPMWTGWNSLLQEDPLPIQKIAYMENITLPPTRFDVVAETLRRSQRVAEECGERYIVVTYDLAVAKPALQIQAAESPAFDNIFICFGGFHIIMAYFGALGYFIEGSGGPDILTDTEVLAVGSLNGFLKGKHYNRCTRLHQVLSCAFQMLHIKRFVLEEGELPVELVENMKSLSDSHSKSLLQRIESSEEFISVMTKYEDFTKRTVQGVYGSTAKYWILYVKLVSIFLKFGRACRTNNVSLYIYALKDMIPIFFAMNRPNYARWMVRFYLNLVNINNTHPGMKEVLEGGALSIRRTSKTFSRVPVDMALEQTVNADAASRQTGIASFSNSESARRRWMLTRSMRSCIVGSLFDMTGLKNTEDVTSTLKDARMKRDNDDVQKVADRIVTTLNPFDIPADDNLYCLTTGKESTEETRNELLNCYSFGEKWKNDFLDGCFSDPSTFEKPIKRRKVRNFTSDALKSKVTSKDRKIIELQGTRDLLGRLLFLSSTNSIDLKKVFQYPLVPVPLSIGNIDGSMNKTDKSKLMQKLEQLCDGTLPAYVDVTFVDAVFLLHTLNNVPRTIGEVSRLILQIICRMSNVVHVVCDTYITPSIKDIERSRRGECNAAYSVMGKFQKTPNNWQKALQSPAFKTALFRFLAKDWQSTEYASILHGHEIYLGFDETCYRFKEEHGNTMYEDSLQYHCQHEEADTRLLYHLQICLNENNNNISCAVRCNDTDIFILLIYHLSILQVSNVWMDAGLCTRNTRRYINVGSINANIGSSVAKALPGLHAFTGCDYTTAFANKGKMKPFEIMMKNDKYITAFSELGNVSAVTAGTAETIESFVCQLYGKSEQTDVNEVRHCLFQDKYSVKRCRKASSPLGSIKGLNPSCIPPCHTVLAQKIKRANYVAGVWKRANERKPAQMLPEEHGWSLVGDSFKLIWFEGDQLPQSVVDLIVTEAMQNESNDDLVEDDIRANDGQISSDSEYDQEEEEIDSC